MLLRQPAFTAVAVLTLALGIGANTAIFTLFNAILLQSLPVHEPARLVLFSDQPGEGTSAGDPPTGRWNRFSFEVYDYLKPAAAAVRVADGRAERRGAGVGAPGGRVGGRRAGGARSGAPGLRQLLRDDGRVGGVGRVLDAQDDRARRRAGGGRQLRLLVAAAQCRSDTRSAAP